MVTVYYYVIVYCINGRDRLRTLTNVDYPYGSFESCKRAMDLAIDYLYSRYPCDVRDYRVESVMMEYNPHKFYFYDIDRDPLK